MPSEGVPLMRDGFAPFSGNLGSERLVKSRTWNGQGDLFVG